MKRRRVSMMKGVLLSKEKENMIMFIYKEKESISINSLGFSIHDSKIL